MKISTVHELRISRLLSVDVKGNLILQYWRIHGWKNTGSNFEKGGYVNLALRYLNFGENTNIISIN